MFDFRPGAIARDLNLQAPIYSVTTAGGHFGRVPDREGEFPWEVIDEKRISALKESK